MARKSEPPLDIKELVELHDLELAAEGRTMDDVTRSLRARLDRLRKGNRTARRVPKLTGVTLESRVSALEREVKRLGRLLGKEQKNG